MVNKTLSDGAHFTSKHRRESTLRRIGSGWAASKNPFSIDNPGGRGGSPVGSLSNQSVTGLTVENFISSMSKLSNSRKLSRKKFKF